MNESIYGERTASEPQDRVTELIEQQTAISEVLRAIASSPHDLQPIFDAILDSATRRSGPQTGATVHRPTHFHIQGLRCASHHCLGEHPSRAAISRDAER